MRSPSKCSRTNRSGFRPPRHYLAATAGIALALLLFASSGALAMPVNVSPNNLANCDPLGLAPTTADGLAAVDELGTSGFPADETIVATWAFTEDRACPTSPSDPDIPGNQVVLQIENTTGLAFSNLWYVSDPETSISNFDGRVDNQEAFKIDNVGLNAPLISESGSIPLVFEAGEIWVFVIDNYSNAFGLTPDLLASVGLVGDFSSTVPGAHDFSSGSIIATVVPEPGTALLMGLGLMGLGLAGGEGRRPAPRPRRRGGLGRPLAIPLSACACLVAGLTSSAAAIPLPLTGSGPHLIAPSPNPDPFYTSHSWTSIRVPDPQNPGLLVFDPPVGTTLKNPWQGNFEHAQGPGLASQNVGLNTFNFSGLNGDAMSPGTLAAESLITLSDLDEGGSAGTNEWLRLTARDSNNSVITLPWLSVAIATSGNPNGNPHPLPGWTWDGSSYLLDSVFIGTPNPSMAVRLVTLLPIYELDFDKAKINYGVSFGAQIEAIPEPSTAFLVGVGLSGLALTRRRK